MLHSGPTERCATFCGTSSRLALPTFREIPYWVLPLDLAYLLLVLYWMAGYSAMTLDSFRSAETKAGSLAEGWACLCPSRRHLVCCDPRLQHVIVDKRRAAEYLEKYFLLPLESVRAFAAAPCRGKSDRGTETLCGLDEGHSYK